MLNYKYRNYSKEELDIILLRYVNKTEIANQWDTMLNRRKHHNLPYSHTIMDILTVNKWDTVHQHSLKLLAEYCSLHNVSTNEVPKHIEEEYQKMLIQYVMEPFIDHVISVRKYNEFRRNHSELHLPHSQKIISNFGSWNDFREAMNLSKNSTGNPVTFTDEKLLEILEDHQTFFTTHEVWEQHIREHKSKTDETLPTMNWIKTRLDRKTLLKYNNSLHRTEEELLGVLKEHSHAYLNGITYWTAYAKKYGLPSYITFVRNLTDEQINDVLKQNN